MPRGLVKKTIVVATALPVAGFAQVADATKRQDVATRLRSWADGTSRGTLAVTVPLWLIVVLRGVLYPAFGAGDLRNSWGGPTLAGAWAVHLAVWTALGSLEAPYLGNEDGVMPKELSPGKPNTRRYTPEEKAQAVRLVRQLRKELGSDHGTIQRVAAQLGYGTESVRKWVHQADTDAGVAPGVTTAEAARVKKLEQENRELRRANEILRRASAFFAAELDRPSK